MSVLYRDAYCVLTREAGESLVRFRRTATTFTDVGAVEQFKVRLGLAITGRERPQLEVMMDMRDGPISTGSALEVQVVSVFGDWIKLFRKRAVLVRTAVGGLQARRMSRELRHDVTVFADEAEALGFLRAP